MVETIEWTPAGVVMIDQTRLPLHEEYVTCRTYEDVAVAIRNMVIRGAPAIGVAAAMGVALGVAHADGGDLDAQVEQICDTLARTRPTAVNLFWALDRMRKLYRRSAIRWRAPAPPPSTFSGRWTACESSINRCAACRWPKSASAWPPKRGGSAWRISPSTKPSGGTGRIWCPTTRRCSRIATPARWRLRAMAPRWA